MHHTHLSVVLLRVFPIRGGKKKKNNTKETCTSSKEFCHCLPLSLEPLLHTQFML